MSRFLSLVLLLLIASFARPVFISGGAYAATPEETQKYLEASKALREENCQKAKALLDELLKSCSDADLAIKADEKLSEAIDCMKKGLLPKTPGVYGVTKTGTLTPLNKEPIGQAQLMKAGSTSLIDALNAPRVNFVLSLGTVMMPADMMDGIIVYNPNLTSVAGVECDYLEPIAAGTRQWIDLPDAAQGRTVHVMYSEWSDQGVGGSKFGSDMIVKTKLGEGMYKLAFPADYVPTGPRNLAVSDGSGYGYPFVMQPSVVQMLNDQYVSKGVSTDEALQAIEAAMSQKPDNADLADMLTLTLMRRGEFSKALPAAHKTVEIAQAKGHSRTAEFVSRVGQVEAAQIVDDVKHNYFDDAAKDSVALAMLQDAASKDPKNAEGYYLSSRIYAREKDFTRAASRAESAFKLNGQYKDHYNQMKAENLLAEVERDCPNGSGDVQTCIEKAKAADQCVEDNAAAKHALGHLYAAAGKSKDAMKWAERAAKLAKKQKVQLTGTYYHELAVICSNSNEIKDAIDAEKQAIEFAEANGLPADEWKAQLAVYEAQKH